MHSWRNPSAAKPDFGPGTVGLKEADKWLVPTQPKVVRGFKITNCNLKGKSLLKALRGVGGDLIAVFFVTPILMNRMNRSQFVTRIGKAPDPRR